LQIIFIFFILLIEFAIFESYDFCEQDGSFEQKSWCNVRKLLHNVWWWRCYTGFFKIFFVAKHRKMVGGCELRFRDKGDERKAGKQRAKCVHERPFDIMRCSSFVARIRNINANGDRYVSTSIATRAYEPLVSYFIFPFETARRFTSSKGLKLVANRHVHVLIILSV